MKTETETNEHERICDARRLSMRKMMANLSEWSMHKSKNNIIDTEKSLIELQAVVENMKKELDKIS